MNSGNDIATAQDKHKDIELKVIVYELKKCIDMTESMLNISMIICNKNKAASGWMK